MQGVEFEWQQHGKAIPPPKDRQPSQGNYKEMPEGVQAQPDQQPRGVDGDGEQRVDMDQRQDYGRENDEAQSYVNELIEKASAVSGTHS